jgi:hypothetical protein
MNQKRAKGLRALCPTREIYQRTKREAIKGPTQTAQITNPVKMRATKLTARPMNARPADENTILLGAIGQILSITKQDRGFARTLISNAAPILLGDVDPIKWLAHGPRLNAGRVLRRILANA